MLLTRPVRWSVFRTSPRCYSFHLRSCPRSDRLFMTNRSYTTADPSYLSPSIQKTKIFHFSWLRSRSLIRLSGPDVLPFLQGLITANITKFELPSAAIRPIYTAFLNAQGRVINDVFLWRGHQPDGSGEAPWLIDVDAASRGILIAHLKKHKLRSKLKMENVSDEELRIYQGWVDEECEVLEEQKKEFNWEVRDARYHGLESPPTLPGSYPSWTVDQGIALSDPRPNMGLRWIGTAEGMAYDALRLTSAYDQSVHGQSALVSEEEYKLHRTLHGIAEGQNEIISGSALPQESNIDFFDGIDFRKGCYLGQELTVRTHHTGVVRKRILPVQLYREYAPILPNAKGPTFVEDPKHPNSLNWDQGLPPPGSNISKVLSRGRSTGKWLGGIGNIGLALCRLEMMTDIRLTEEPTQYDPDQEFKISWDAQPGYEPGEARVKAFVPQWLRDRINASLKSRERNSAKDEDSYEVD